MTPAGANVFVAREGDTAFIRVTGRATFACSSPLRQYAVQQIESGARRFVFELGSCTFMDSTFMGLLATLVVRYGQHDIKVSLLNVANEVISQLHELGLYDLFEFINTTERANAETGVGDKLEANDDAKTEEALRETMIEAHRALGEACAENVPRFKDVMKCLEDSRP